ncbi:MAG TPA: ABC transporter ATP-binding protein [Candidatus Saccharimonadales bacterium]|nr:ABC transporter ATP-binding protein [Candidatus Saccharimonadales bacterium]
MRTLREMFRLIRDQNKRLVTTVILNTILGLGALAPPYFLKIIIDQLIAIANGQADSTSYANTVVLALGALGLLRLALAGVSYTQERLSDLLRLDAIIQLRRRLFEHVLKLSIDYYETHRAGEIVQRLTQSMYEFGVWLQDLSQLFLLRILTIAFSVVVVWFVHPLAGLIITVTVALKLWLALYKKQVSRGHRNMAREVLEKLQGQITESIQNLTTLRTFGGEASAVHAHRGLAADMRVARLAQHRIEWRYNAGLEAVEGIGVVMTLGVIAAATLRGGATPGDIVLVALYLQQVMINLKPMANFIDITGELVTSCQRALELLHVEPTVVNAPGARTLNRLTQIEFHSVDFNYPGHDSEVLKNVSFSVSPGQMIALVGPSGTGKTTIVKLLLRLYEPTGGQILINGEDISCFTAESLRGHIGTVMQDVVLFNDSFAANVLLAKPDASGVELSQAVSSAHAGEFVDRLPQGVETLVGERGIKLSGGQKQRVAIARAILKQPDLIILDEATSALDSSNEREVQKGLNELLKGRMAVVIAHRLSTVQHATELLVIENGTIVERGTHAALLKQNQSYAKLFHLQNQRIL